MQRCEHGSTEVHCPKCIARHLGIKLGERPEPLGTTLDGGGTPAPQTETPISAGNGFIYCPFCGDNDFDHIGLKIHLTSGHCDEFSELDVSGNGVQAAAGGLTQTPLEG